MSIDINYVRQLDAKLHNIPLCDDNMTFFYDETGNCGKFYLREDGVNDPIALNNDFILGGIAYDGPECPADTEKLLATLKLQSKELKFGNICRSKDFMTFIGSYRASIYVDWLYNSELYVHYATINNLYYALVDMVDSLWESQPQFIFSLKWIMQLKSALHGFCRSHFKEVSELLCRFHYPNVEHAKTSDFCNMFCDLIQNYNEDTTKEGFLVECFRQMLNYAGRHGDLPFLYNNENNLLVEEYYTLYLGRCYTYKNAIHHFDFEKVISSNMQNTSMTDNGTEFINYDFLDSKQTVLIQVCDVFVGLLAKLFKYLDNISIEDIAKIDAQKNKAQLSNISKIYALISRADTRHQMMIQNANDIRLVQERMQKSQMLIELRV